MDFVLVGVRQEVVEPAVGSFEFDLIGGQEEAPGSVWQPVKSIPASARRLVVKRHALHVSCGFNLLRFGGESQAPFQDWL